MFSKVLFVIALKTVVSIQDQNVLNGPTRNKELTNIFNEDLDLFSPNTDVSTKNNTKRWAPYLNYPHNVITFSSTKTNQATHPQQALWQQTFWKTFPFPTTNQGKKQSGKKLRNSWVPNLESFPLLRWPKAKTGQENQILNTFPLKFQTQGFNN